MLSRNLWIQTSCSEAIQAPICDEQVVRDCALNIVQVQPLKICGAKSKRKPIKIDIILERKDWRDRMPFLCQLRGPQAVGGLLSLGLLAKWPERSNCTWKTPWIFVYFSWQYNSPVRAPWLDSAYKKYIINYSFSHPELHTTDIVCVCVCAKVVYIDFSVNGPKTTPACLLPFHSQHPPLNAWSLSLLHHHWPSPQCETKDDFTLLEIDSPTQITFVDGYVNQCHLLWCLNVKWHGRRVTDAVVKLGQFNVSLWMKKNII